MHTTSFVLSICIYSVERHKDIDVKILSLIDYDNDVKFIYRLYNKSYLLKMTNAVPLHFLKHSFITFPL